MKKIIFALLLILSPAVSRCEEGADFKTLNGFVYSYAGSAMTQTLFKMSGSHSSARHWVAAGVGLGIAAAYVFSGPGDMSQKMDLNKLGGGVGGTVLAGAFNWKF